MSENLLTRRLGLFPVSTRVEETGSGERRLSVAGCDLFELAEEYGTPLYLYDRLSLDQAVQRYREALANSYPAESGITYAGKAFLCLAIGEWALGQGLWLDCTGATELGIAGKAGLPRRSLLMHGVSKSPRDLQAALGQAGTIVVDNLDELGQLLELFKPGAVSPVEVWLRLRPGVTVATHSYTQTGQELSKFGMSPAELETAVLRSLEAGLSPTGLHFHLGSHFHDPAPLGPAIDLALELAAGIREKTGWQPQVFCPGGGWGMPYHETDLPHRPLEDYVRFISQRLQVACAGHGLQLPRLQLEPGRSLVAQAGVSLYRVQALKHTRDRRWLLVDGGLADNPRPALYGARYSALPVSEPERPSSGPCWIGGPYCESGDVLIEDLPMPAMTPGEYLAIPVSGAYQLSMGSNYNGALMPAVLWLEDGGATLIRRRETFEDLLGRDLPLGGKAPSLSDGHSQHA